MKTDVIAIRSDMAGTSEAMKQAERFAVYHGLSAKDALHIRLLTEETVSMVHGILDDFQGDFWLESVPSDKGMLCRICVSAKVSVSDGQEDELLKVATSGKNEEAKSLMGKIRQIFRWTIQQNTDMREQDSSVDMWYEMGTSREALDYGAAVYWSLKQYRVNAEHAPKPKDREWDELEKSIVGKLADEVRVGIRSEKAVVTIEKFFPNA